MPIITFSEINHQKVRYIGASKSDLKGRLFIVSLDEFDFFEMDDEDELVVHPVSENDLVTLPDDALQAVIHTVRRRDLVTVSDKIRN